MTTSNELSITHFIPLIGPWVMGADQLQGEFKIDEKYIFSFEPFTNNQQHITANFPSKTITYLPEDILPDYAYPGWEDNSSYVNYIKDNSIEKTDLMLAVPPCAGLSMLNTGNRGAGCAANRWMYETVKWNVAQGNKCLLLENAPGLVGAEGVKVLREIERILTHLGVRDEYKLHCTKTNTMQHGLPQNRQRTFLFVYKAEEFKIFKNITNDLPTLEEFFDKNARPEEVEPGTNHDVLTPGHASEPLQYLNKFELWDEARSQVDTFGTKTVSKMLLRHYEEFPERFTEFPKLTRVLEHFNEKLSRNLGYWDSNPMVAKGKVNAVIAKNAFNIIHPKYNRVLTVRELMDLMGLPNDFVLQGDIKKNFNHICQSLPVNTGKDHIRWAHGIINNDAKYVSSGSSISSDIFLQNNSKGDLENDLLEVKGSSVEFKKISRNKKTILKSFLN